MMKWWGWGDPNLTLAELRHILKPNQITLDPLERLLHSYDFGGS
jgi:hypothetical protein